MQFGETIPGLKIYGKPAPYPVLNERDVRAGAGIMLALGGVAFSFAVLVQYYIFLQIFVILFAVEFFLRVVFSPKVAPIYQLGRLLVFNQVPEYSGAVQKRFAWSLGLILASTMVVIVNILGIHGVLPFSICILCLSLLWLEAALGICVGCKMYNAIIALGWHTPKVKEACPGGVCSLDQNNKNN